MFRSAYDQRAAARYPKGGRWHRQPMTDGKVRIMDDHRAKWALLAWGALQVTRHVRCVDEAHTATSLLARPAVEDSHRTRYVGVSQR